VRHYGKTEAFVESTLPPCGSPGCQDEDCLISPGYCHCGCGEKAPIADKTYLRYRRVRGFPKPCIASHHLRFNLAVLAARHRDLSSENSPRWKGDAVTRVAAHSWLRRHFPKTGVCEECKDPVGATGHAGTHFAYKGPNGEYSRERGDYLELCPTCHRRFDKDKPGVDWHKSRDALGRFAKKPLDRRAA
jgi:hypothetical protein